MRNPAASALLLLFCLGITSVGSAAAPTEPAVTLTPTRIEVTGITPGADVLFFGAGLEPKRYQAVVHRWSSVVTDTALKGAVFFDLTPPVTWNAVWVVADLRTGKYAIASTAGFSVVHAAVLRKQLQKDAAGVVSRFSYGADAADVLYLTPGAAWTIYASSGDLTDSHGNADGSTLIDLSRGTAVGDRKQKPIAFGPEGTLLIIDPTRLDLLELRIDAAMLNEARP
jgi:hypothetical protein